MNAQTFALLTSGGAGNSPWLSATLEQLAVIRGDMWPNIGSVGLYGGKPGNPRILAMDYYEWCDEPTRQQMREKYSTYLSRGWSHAVTGPMVDAGYHGLYPEQPTVPTQSQWDHYLDCMEELWRNVPMIAPVHFVHPDGWSLEDMDRLAHLYQQPRAQRLIRIIVPCGWEPTRYDWKACTWAAIMRKVIGWYNGGPAPLVLLHTVSDVDAPTGDGDDQGYDLHHDAAVMSMSLDELCDHLRVPRGTTHLDPSNATAWRYVVPYLHGWLIQNGPDDYAPSQNPPRAKGFGDQFDVTMGGSFASRFERGYAGWPTWSRWPGRSLMLFNGENTAYEKFWQNLPESAAREWGQYAIARGANGALDGV